MAIILPMLLGLAGAATDLARAYQAQITIESAVRNAAEWVAPNSATAAAAATDARRIVCLEARGLPGFVSGVEPIPDETCTSPAVVVDTFSINATAIGGTPRNPIGTSSISAELPFRTLVPYPFLPRGTLTLTADATFTVVRGR
jgi:Flp pilus assembly protein TadG